MADIQKEKMFSLADRLEQQYGIQTRRLYLDLAESKSLAPMLETIRETSCRLIIYNAAYSRIKKFREAGEEDLERYLGINVEGPLRLVHAFIQNQDGLSEEKKGIILMSSMAGLWGTGLLAAYGASKAFNLVLAESLHHELKADNIDVLACVAGATTTPAYLGTNPRYGRIRPALLAPEKVSESALKVLGKKALCIPGWKNRLTFFMMTRVFSRKRTVALFNQTTGKMYPNS